MGTNNAKYIVIVLDSLNLGGAERQGIFLAGKLKERGYSVKVLGLGVEGNAVSMLKDYDLEYENLGLTLYTHHPSVIRINKKELRRWLKKTQPGVVLPYTYWPNLYCNLVAKKAGVQKVVWNQRDLGHNFGEFPKLPMAIKKADLVIGNSEACIQAVQRITPLSDYKVIHNGISESFLEIPSKCEDTAPMRAVMVANIQKNKDHSTLIQAWSILRDKLADNCPLLTLAGAHRGKFESVNALVNELDLHDYISMPGLIENVPKLLAEMNFCVFSSNTEGSPNGLLECMAAGVPVVATDIPSIREAVGLEYEYLVPVNSPDIFASKILALIASNENLRSSGEYCRNRIRNGFSEEKMVNEYVQLIEG